MCIFLIDRKMYRGTKKKSYRAQPCVQGLWDFLLLGISRVSHDDQREI